MSHKYYNPIVRSFNRYREAFRTAADVPRASIRPDTRLDSLVPRERRQVVWAAVEKRGLRMPPLQPTAPAALAGTSFVVVGGCVVWKLTDSFWPTASAIVQLGALTVRTVRRWSAEVPRSVVTVGDLAVWGTHFPDHADSGHRWTRGEVTHKVRLLLAESFGISLDEIHPESRLTEDLGLE